MPTIRQLKSPRGGPDPAGAMGSREGEGTPLENRIGRASGVRESRHAERHFVATGRKGACDLQRCCNAVFSDRAKRGAKGPGNPSQPREEGGQPCKAIAANVLPKKDGKKRPGNGRETAGKGPAKDTRAAGGPRTAGRCRQPLAIRRHGEATADWRALLGPGGPKSNPSGSILRGLPTDPAPVQ
jgi:hypothetical protein